MKRKNFSPVLYKSSRSDYLLFACVACVVSGLVSWCSSASFRYQGRGDHLPCPLPPQVRAGQEPLQTAVPPGMETFVLEASTLRPLAGFSVDARVLSRKNYDSGFESKLSPTDLALGWQGMREPAVLSRLKITQSARQYKVSWEGSPPLPVQEMQRSSANMQIIPATNAVAWALARVGRSDHVRIDGWLVEAYLPPSREPWRSSVSRTDTGSDASEVVYVCALTRF